jgi:hypothetical protein
MILNLLAHTFPIRTKRKRTREISKRTPLRARKVFTPKYLTSHVLPQASSKTWAAKHRSRKR